jgi:hypothetical protein
MSLVLLIYIPTHKSGMEGSKVGLVLVVLRNLHIDFHSGCTSLHSCQQCIKVPFPSHLPQHLLLVFLMIASLTGVIWNLSVVLICISFMATNVEHFIYLLAI